MPTRKKYVFLPSPGKLFVLKVDPVASIAHLGSPAGIAEMARVEAEHHLALMIKVLEEPRPTKDVHACLVAILPEPPALTGLITSCSPVGYEVVRIRTEVVALQPFLTCDPALRRRIVREAEAYLSRRVAHVGVVEEEDDGSESDSDAATVTPRTYSAIEPIPFREEDLDWQPVVTFSYVWPEDGLYDPEDWLGARKEVVDAILRHRSEQGLTDKTPDHAEHADDIAVAQGQSGTNNLACPVADPCRVVQLVLDRPLKRRYTRDGNIWTMDTFAVGAPPLKSSISA